MEINLHCMGCPDGRVPPGKGRLCVDCLNAVWAHDWDCWEFTDAHTNMLREIAKEDQERVHQIQQENRA